MPNILAGALAGLSATAAMTVPMVWARRTARVDAIGPEHIVGAAFDVLGVEASREQHLSVTAVAHLGYGAAAGVVFATGGGHRRIRSGLAYGIAIGVAGYQGWVPAMGVLPPLTRAPKGRRIEVLVSHLVYGTVLAAACNRLTLDP